MDEPTTYEKTHWKVFRIGAKVFGFGLIIVSLIFTVLITGSLLGLTNLNDYPVWLLILFVPLIPLGALIVRSKSYYPKQYKDKYERDLQ